MTEVIGRCIIFDYDFSGLVYAEGVDISGGAAGVEELATSARYYADIRGKGRQPKRYKVRARATTREDIETFLRTCNTLPDEAEFFPFDAERAGYIASGHASLLSPRQRGDGKLFYEAEAELIMRESWLYGPDQGILFGWYRALPAVSSLISNDGHERSPISYMQCSGDYAGGYVEDLSVRIVLDGGERDRELALCDKMMRRDIFELGWRGEVRHSYEYNCDRLVSELSTDLHGLVSGGLWTGENLLLTNGDYVMIPFYGPLPVAGSAGAASLELDIASLGGGDGAVRIAEEADLSDAADVDHDDLVAGKQTIAIPDLQGKGTVIMGIKADADPFTPFAGPTAGNCLGVAVAPDGTIYVVSDLGNLWSWTAATGWVQESTATLLDVGVSPTGTVFVINSDGSLSKWISGETYTALGGATITSLAVLDDTHIYLRTSTADQLWLNDGTPSGWTYTGIGATRIAVLANGTLLGIVGGVLYYAAGSPLAWISLGGSNLADVTGYDIQNIYASKTDGTVWKYTGTWAQLTGPDGITYIDVSCYGVLAGVTDDAKVWLRPYILLSLIKGVVNRYIAPSKIPFADPDEDFYIKVESSGGDQLRFLQAVYNNRYWY